MSKGLTQGPSTECPIRGAGDQAQARIPHIDLLPFITHTPFSIEGMLHFGRNHRRERFKASSQLVTDDINMNAKIRDFFVPDGPSRLQCLVLRGMDIEAALGETIHALQLGWGYNDGRSPLDTGQNEGNICLGILNPHKIKPTLEA